MTDTYCFAEIRVRITTVTQGVHYLCSGYAADGPADFAVRTAREEIEYERSRAEYPGCPDEYLESLAVCRKIAERMPEYDTFLFHGSAIAVDGQAYIFTAASGTGKSTHTRLWRELTGGRAVMVNDDKPLIRVSRDGTATVYGTPWDGKHHLSSNTAARVAAICILEQSADNRIRGIPREEAMDMLVQQTYRPAGPETLARTLALLDRMDVRFYRLACNMDISAAELSYRTMAGEQPEC